MAARAGTTGMFLADEAGPTRPAGRTRPAVEILLVDPQRASARVVAEELQACGFSVAVARRSCEALELAARLRPALVLAVAVIDEIDGPELAAVLRLVRTTAAIPFALLTSYEPGHPTLSRLPPGTAVIRRGAGFARGVEREASRLGLA